MTGQSAVQHEPPVVVSLTSYPARISRAAATIESILRQSVRPNLVVMAVAESQFPERCLPQSISGFVRSGALEILWMQRDAKVFMKMLPARRAFPEAVVITADDDVIYPISWLEDLLTALDLRDGDLVGHRGTEILLGSHGPLPYATWPRATRATASNRIQLTGHGGVAFRPGLLAPEFADVDRALDLCPTNDDLWFTAMALYTGCGSRVVADTYVDVPDVPMPTRAGALLRTNVEQGANDAQFARVLGAFGLHDRLSAEASS